MRKVLAIILSFLIMLSGQSVLALDENKSDIKVYINGSELDTGDSAPVIINSRTMVPMRSIFESLGAEVLWDDTNKKVIATAGEVIIEITVGEDRAVVGEKEVLLDSPAIIKEEKVYVPARFVSEALGYNVEWKEERKAVYIWTINPDVLSALRNFESLADENLIKWYASLYDKESGGFYFAVSSRDTVGFAPTIEGTNWILNVLKTIGIIPRTKVLPDDVYVPEEFKEKLLGFLIPLQDEGDGYFYEPQYGKSVSETKRTRDMVAEDMIIYFGGQCRYLTPAQRVSAQASLSEVEEIDLSTLAEHFHSREKFKEWVYSLDMKNDPYNAGSQLSTAYNMAKRLGYDDIGREFLKETQNKNTGLWGGDADATGIDGALKVSYYFSADTEPYPYLDKMLDSVLKIMDEEDMSENIGMARNWNRLAIIDKAMNSYAEIPSDVKTKVDESLVKILNQTCEKIKMYRQSDFGYSNYMDGSTVTASDATVSLGLKEGDTNGTTLAFDCLRTAWSLAGVSDIPFERMEEYRDLFWELIENAKPNEKPEPDMDFHFNFDGEIPLVSMRGKEFVGYTIGNNVHFYLKAEEARSATTTRNTGVGKENFEDEIKKMPVLKSNGEVIENAVVKIGDGEYKVTAGNKEYNVFVKRSILQLYHPFEGTTRNDAPSVTGMPKWHTGVLGPGTWNWMSQRYDGNTKTEIVDDVQLGSKVFRLEKIVGTNDASFRSSYGAPEEGIKTVVSNVKIKVDSMSGFYECELSRGIYIGGIGGDSSYEGRHALVLTREGKPSYDKTMAVKYIKTPAQDEKFLNMPDTLSLNLGQWYNITLVYENEKNDDGTFKGTFKVFVDNKFIFETADTYESDLNLNTSHTGIYGFYQKNCGPTEYTLSIDDYQVEFIKEESDNQ